ncbi:helix-turn-helix domain-containing protein [Lutimonas halocynthiae]|uniref:helix-turn-helix domain-containing protein n=1 Tax=Lutimonas halocynthiae TaxID=1446477 RepID=UPI0025B4D85D|nr:helix-turn-helix domain-containing protein [Lutimonas halocynthiae]MDN3643609.1 helix-turn-helix domain-containing protein [Lutimonas halocynthiae]
MKRGEKIKSYIDTFELDVEVNKYEYDSIRFNKKRSFLYLLLDFKKGSTYTSVGLKLGVNRRTVKRWQINFEEGGIERLFKKYKSGRRTRRVINDEVEEFIKDWLALRSHRSLDLSCKLLCRDIQTKYRINIKYGTVYRAIKRFS